LRLNIDVIYENENFHSPRLLTRVSVDMVIDFSYVILMNLRSGRDVKMSFNPRVQAGLD